MKDFGNEEYSGDCFELVGRLNGLDCRNPKDFVEIMRIIDRDLYLGLSRNDNLEENRPMGTNSEFDVPADIPVERRKRPYATVQVRHPGKHPEAISGGFIKEIQQRKCGW